MNETYYHWIGSPIGKILLTATDRALTRLALADQKYFPQIIDTWIAQPDAPIVQQATMQLDRYFRQERHTFDLPLAPAGTPFQQQVWQQLCQIPWGETRSYGQLARAIDLPTGARAVGMANGRNPIAIIIPCHRAIASSGKLAGYAGGIERKQWLLQHESIARPN